MTVRKDTLMLPDGRIKDDYWSLEYPDWINVIAITQDGKYLFERQYRHGLDVVEWEIPAGVIEKGEEPMAAAQRELMEETGFGGGEWEPFMNLCPNPGTNNNIAHTFLARAWNMQARNILMPMKTWMSTFSRLLRCVASLSGVRSCRR